MTLLHDITKEPTAYWKSGNPAGDTLWRHIKEDPHILTDTVTLTAAQVKALADTQIELVAAPGADKYLEFIRATLILNFVGAYDDASADGNLQICYTDGAGVSPSGAIEAAVFICLLYTSPSPRDRS